MGTLFLSTFINKIDKKGRVSVPAHFRAALAGQSFNGIVAYASFINPCIEASGIERIRKLSEDIETLSPYSDERDVFATAILGGAHELAFDSEGRVMLPAEMIEEIKLDGNALFVGKGETFEIWEPASFKLHAAQAKNVAREKRLSLRSVRTENK